MAIFKDTSHPSPKRQVDSGQTHGSPGLKSHLPNPKPSSSSNSHCEIRNITILNLRLSHNTLYQLHSLKTQGEIDAIMEFLKEIYALPSEF